jgi:hypothetical protein
VNRSRFSAGLGWAIALVLLPAAGLKAYSLTIDPIAPSGYFGTRLFQAQVVAFELILAGWLISGRGSAIAWKVAMVVFTAFAARNLYGAFNGESDCGCFGPIGVNPWIMSGVDTGIAVSLFLLWPLGASRSRKLWRLVLPCAGLLIIAIAAASAALSQPEIATLNEDGKIEGERLHVRLEPKEWIGKRFPLAAHIRVSAWLDHGTYLVLLHRRGCPRCQEEIEKLAQDARESAFRNNPTRIVFVEVMDPGTNEPSRDSRMDCCDSGFLDPARTWHVTTPLTILLQDGVVLGILSGS